MVDCQESVRVFHKATLIPIGWKPSVLSADRLKLRLKLFDEFIELLYAAGVPSHMCERLKGAINSCIDRLDGQHQDIVEMADALGDIVVVAFGMAIEMGIDLNRVFAEIMRANMSKLDEDGNPLINVCVDPDCRQLNRHNSPAVPPCKIQSHLVKPDDPHGKVLKASGYRPPDIKSVLDSQEALMT